MALAACALLCASLAAAPAPGEAPTLALAGARGAFRISNSHSGNAIVVARNMRPGGSTVGTVTVVNRGRSAAQLFLTGSHPRDRLGPGGGRLSSRLDLTVEEARRTLASGGVNPFAGCHRLGRIGSGRSRTFKFTMRFRGGPAADNSYARSSAAVDLRWGVSDRGGCATRGGAPRSGAALKGQLPFTGYGLAGAALAGCSLLAGGAALRRRRSPS